MMTLEKALKYLKETYKINVSDVIDEDMFLKALVKNEKLAKKLINLKNKKEVEKVFEELFYNNSCNYCKYIYFKYAR